MMGDQSPLHSLLVFCVFVVLEPVLRGLVYASQVLYQATSLAPAISEVL